MLYPRSDSRTPDGQIPNFPVDFTLRTSSTVLDADDRRQDRHRPAEPARARTSATRCRSSRKPFDARAKPVAEARLYVAGLGAYEATVNGKTVTDTVLNPGVTNPLRSVEYGTYDVTDLVEDGDNTLGVALGNGQTNVYPQANAATGRTDVYTKFNSRPGARTAR